MEHDPRIDFSSATQLLPGEVARPTVGTKWPRGIPQFVTSITTLESDFAPLQTIPIRAVQRRNCRQGFFVFSHDATPSDKSVNHHRH
jgi:hypothetical protein